MKKYFYIILSLFFLVSSFTPVLKSYAISEEEQKKRDEFLENFKKEDDGLQDNIENNVNVLQDREKWKTERDNSLKYFLQYIFVPQYYIENVDNNEFVDDKVDKTVVQDYNGHKTVCYFKNEPQNLLNHNCDIPAFGTELFQNITREFTKSGLQNYGKTSSSLGGFKLGLPKGIKKVPVNPNDRTENYTALELYGYNLEYTSYLGEYDHIVTSSEARLLANIGFWGGVKLGAKSILNGINSILNEFIGGWIFNPSKWGQKVDAFASGVVSTVIDTSDTNIVALHNWKRPYFANTLYNAYYLPDKLIIEKAKADFLKYISENIILKLAQTEQGKEVIYLMPPNATKDGRCKIRKKKPDKYQEGHCAGIYFPVFTFDPHKYTKESIKEHEAWEKCTKNCGSEPELVVMSEEEQFKEWKKEPYQVDYDKRGKAKGIDCFDSATKYSELTSCWTEPYKQYAFNEISHDTVLTQKLLKDIEKEFFEKNEKYNVNKGLSHYICANEEGKVSDLMAEWEYVYNGENTRESENLNSNCKPVRPSIKGGKYGSGDNFSDDTRYIQFTKDYSASNPKFWKGISSFVTQFTNTFITLSYTNFVKMFEMDTMISTTIETLRDSLFFPLSILAGAFYGLYIIISYIRKREQVGIDLIKWFIVYLVSCAILFNANLIMFYIEEIPTALDNSIAKMVFDKNSVSYCEVEGKNKAVRQIQCLIWNIGVFNPWVYGQFGTNYHDLDEENMKNTNSNLVGSPIVNLGNNKTEKNWALFQLDKTKSGTITTEDDTQPTGYQSKAMYKLVDLMAGPNNGKQSDSRFLATWSGENSSPREVASFLSVPIMIVLFIIVIKMTLKKLSISIELLLRVLLLPIVLIIGLFPGGKAKLFKYLQDIGNLFLQRFFLMILFTALLNLITQMSATSTNYKVFATTAFCIVLTYLFMWNKILDMIITPNTGLTQAVKESKIIPSSITRRTAMIKETLKQSIYGGVGGAIGGMLSEKELKKEGFETKGNAILEGMKFGAGQEFKRTQRMMFNKQRRLGFDTLDTISQAYSTGKQSIDKKLQNPNVKLRSDIEETYNILNNEKININQEISNLRGKTDKESIERKKNLTQQASRITLAMDSINGVTKNLSQKNWTKLKDDRLTQAVLNINLDNRVKKGKDESNPLNNMIEVSKVEVALDFTNKIHDINNKIDKEQQQLKNDKETVEKVTNKVETVVTPVKNKIMNTKENVTNVVNNTKTNIKNVLETVDTITDSFLSEPVKQAKQQNKDLIDSIKRNENAIEDIIEDISLTEENIENTFNRKMDIKGIDEETKKMNEQAIKGIKDIYNQGIKNSKITRNAYVEDIINEDKNKKPFNIVHKKEDKNDIYNDIIDDNFDIFTEKFQQNNKNEMDK